MVWRAIWYLKFVKHPTYTRVWHMAFLLWEPDAGLLPTHAQWFQKWFEPHHHSPKKEYLRCQVINLTPQGRVRALGDGPSEMQETQVFMNAGFPESVQIKSVVYLNSEEGELFMAHWGIPLDTCGSSPFSGWWLVAGPRVDILVHI